MTILPYTFNFQFPTGFSLEYNLNVYLYHKILSIPYRILTLPIVGFRLKNDDFQFPTGFSLNVQHERDLSLVIFNFQFPTGFSLIHARDVVGVIMNTFNSLPDSHEYMLQRIIQLLTLPFNSLPDSHLNDEFPNAQLYFVIFQFPTGFSPFQRQVGGQPWVFTFNSLPDSHVYTVKDPIQKNVAFNSLPDSHAKEYWGAGGVSYTFQFPTGFSRYIPKRSKQKNKLSIPYRILTMLNIIIYSFVTVTFNSLPDSHTGMQYNPFLFDNSFQFPTGFSPFLPLPIIPLTKINSFNSLPDSHRC